MSPDTDEARSRLLDAAESLFYERGVQAVGMDELRAAAGVSLKRLYRCYPSKADLVRAYLLRRDERWRASLAGHVAQAGDPHDRVLAVFDWLRAWFESPGFRGCAFVNSFGELGSGSPGVAHAARDHKLAVQRYLTGLAEDAGARDPGATAEQLMFLIDGATAAASIYGKPTAALRARDAAAVLLTR